MLQHEDILLLVCDFVVLFFSCSGSFLFLSFIQCIRTTVFSPSIPPSSLPHFPFPTDPLLLFFLQKKTDYPGITTEHDMTRTVNLGTNNHIKTGMANDLEERLPREGRVNPTTTIRS